MPPPPHLTDDAISEILLRLPPGEPKWLFRVALVCKPWLRTVSDPAFLRQYRDFHGAPPLLGLIDGAETIAVGGHARCLVPTTAVPAFSIPKFDDAAPCAWAWPLDCRHGRVLVSMYRDPSAYYLVYDPVTGDRHRVPQPDSGIRLQFDSPAAVFCAAAGCDHLDCHGGPFGLVGVFTDFTSPTHPLWAAMYSSEIGARRAPVTLDNVPNVAYIRGPLIRDEIYFALPQAQALTIVKYDWVNNSLSLVNPKPPTMPDIFVMMVTENQGVFDFLVLPGPAGWPGYGWLKPGPDSASPFV